MTERLKPCRFCGGTTCYIRGAASTYYVMCFWCRAEGPVRLTQAAAAEAWNAPPPPSDAVPRELAVRLAKALAEAPVIAERQEDEADSAESAYDGGSGEAGYRKACDAIAKAIRKNTADAISAARAAGLLGDPAHE